jgi:hypothetical protein
MKAAVGERKTKTRFGNVGKLLLKIAGKFA